MARQSRRGRSRIDPAVFLRQERGEGGGELSELETLMTLLGLGPKAEEAGRQARAQEALEAHQAGLLGLQERQLGISEAEALASAKERAAAEEFRTGATTRDIQYRMDQAARQAEKERAELEEKEKTRRAALFEKLVEHGALKPGTLQYEKALANLGPEYAGMQREIASETAEAKYAENLARYKTMTPEQRRAVSRVPGELGGPDIYKRILAEMGPEGAPPPPPLDITGGAGPVGALMNLPVVGRNIGRYFANIGPNIARSLGVQTGTWPYEEFVDPRKFREAQMVLGQLGEAPVVGPPPAVTPRPEFGNYGPLAAPIEQPPWMYGVGTRR